MKCIYKRSKYYEKAVLEPRKICQPIGYDFFNQSDNNRSLKRTYGDLRNKFLLERSLLRHISSIRTQNSQVSLFLKETQVPRKSYLMSGTNNDALSKQKTAEMIYDLRGRFFGDPIQLGKQRIQNEEIIQLVDLICCLFHNDGFFNVRDYSLSTYFVYYLGKNTQFYTLLTQLLQVDLLEYNHEIIISESNLGRPQLRKIQQFDNIKAINQHISDVLDIGHTKDAFFKGVHLYICDLLPTPSRQSFAQQEREFLPFLRLNVLVMLSILAQGQHAILRIRGTFTQKTNQFIFLLKLAFHRINFAKSLASNPFSHDKYILCESFQQENGKIVAQYMLQNFGSLLRQQWLFTDPKALLINDFQKNILMYNDSSPVMRQKDIEAEYAQNSNINIYPKKQALLNRVRQLRIPNASILVERLDKIIPDEVEKQQQVKKIDEIGEKQAIPIDMQLFDLLPKKNQKKINYHDISKKEADQKERLINSYVSRGDKQIQAKKVKKKQRKTEKEED